MATVTEIVRGAGAAVEAGSHVHSLGALIAMFLNDGRASETKDLPGAIGKYFSKADEGAAWKLTNQIPAKQRELVKRYRAKQRLHRPGDFVFNRVVAYYMAQHIDFVTKLGIDDHRVTGKKKTTTETPATSKGGKPTTKITEEDIIEKVTPPAKKFLMAMAKTLDDPAGFDEGYKKLLEEFASSGIPHVPIDLELQFEAYASQSEAKAAKLQKRMTGWGALRNPVATLVRLVWGPRFN